MHFHSKTRIKSSEVDQDTSNKTWIKASALITLSNGPVKSTSSLSQCALYYTRMKRQDTSKFTQASIFTHSNLKVESPEAFNYECERRGRKVCAKEVIASFLAEASGKKQQQEPGAVDWLDFRLEISKKKEKEHFTETNTHQMNSLTTLPLITIKAITPASGGSLKPCLAQKTFFYSSFTWALTANRLAKQTWISLETHQHKWIMCFFFLPNFSLPK